MSDAEQASQPARDDRPQETERQPDGGAVPRDRDRGKRRTQANQTRRSEPQLPMGELRDLFALFTEHALTDFEFEREGFRVHIGRHPAPQASTAADSQAQMTGATGLMSAPPANAGAQSAEAASGSTTAPQPESLQKEDESIHIIVSPIVGTFYRAPSPTAEPFVRLGSHVDPDSVVCIIEAMKLMNEIQSETSGEIAKIYVENGQPVEYGQPLFGVKK